MASGAIIGGMDLEGWKCEAATLLKARDRILRSQDYSVGDSVIQRRNRRAELEQVQAALKEARANIDKLSALEGAVIAGQTRSVQRIVPS